MRESLTARCLIVLVDGSCGEGMNSPLWTVLGVGRWFDELEDAECCADPDSGGGSKGSHAARSAAHPKVPLRSVDPPAHACVGVVCLNM